MTLFWILTAFITFFILAIVILPIYFHRQEKKVDSQQLSKDIYQDRLQELKTQLQSKELTQDEYDVLYAEQARAFLEEQSELTLSKTTHSYRLPLTIILIIFISAFSLVMYFKFGASKAYSEYLLVKKNNEQIQAQIAELGSLDNIIESMQQRVAETQDAQGYFLLGRLYMRAQRFDDAVTALKQANQLAPNQADTLSAYAESLYFVNGQKLDHQARIVLQQALNANPNQPDALNISAIDAYGRGRYQEAINAWQLLWAQLPGSSEQAQSIANMIEQAQAKLEQQQKSLQANIKLPVKIELADEFKDKLQGTETLFIYAKAAKGSNAPLAIIKSQATKLPIEVVLDETMAMLAMATLADVDQVIIVARVSQSGQSTPQAGDFQGESGTIDLTQIPEQTIVVIDREL
jgi:cytochrome c-type biogenesis protein CcmH